MDFQDGVSVSPSDRSNGVCVLPYPDIPQRWAEYFRFAHEFDGYAAYPDDLGELANGAIKDWNLNQTLSDKLVLLRSCLFYEARRSRFVEGYPSEEDMGYLDALVEKINTNINERFGVMKEITIHNPTTGKLETLGQKEFNRYMTMTNGAVLEWIVGEKVPSQTDSGQNSI